MCSFSAHWYLRYIQSLFCSRVHREHCILGGVSKVHPPPQILSQQTPMLIIKHGLRCHYELRPQEEITFSRGFISYQLTKVEKRDEPADCLYTVCVSLAVGGYTNRAVMKIYRQFMGKISGNGTDSLMVPVLLPFDPSYFFKLCFPLFISLVFLCLCVLCLWYSPVPILAPALFLCLCLLCFVCFPSL